MLAKRRRLSKELVRKVIKEGKAVRDRNLSLKYLLAPAETAAFSFIVPAKTAKSAVRRNKLKRMARAGILKIIPDLRKNLFAVVFFGRGSRDMKFQEIKEALADLFRRAGLLI